MHQSKLPTWNKQGLLLASAGQIQLPNLQGQKGAIGTHHHTDDLSQNDGDSPSVHTNLQMHNSLMAPSLFGDLDWLVRPKV